TGHRGHRTSRPSNQLSTTACVRSPTPYARVDQRELDGLSRFSRGARLANAIAATAACHRVEIPAYPGGGRLAGISFVPLV
ncbi:MAG TPA: hypothetical protein VGK55_09845, partial [Actinomycetes bacterium]